ncbi:MAG: putative internalin, partial [Frankiales bacterium]|nr:putative internalin [Frankiales bacterium]
MSRRTGPFRGPGHAVPAALVAVLAVLATGLFLGAPATAQTVSDTTTVTTDPSPSPDPSSVPDPSPSPSPSPSATAPAAPRVDLAVTGARDVRWTWAQGGATATCTLVGPTATDTRDLPCDGGALAVTLDPVPGSYALRVALTADGLPGDAGTSPAFVVDPAPDAPADVTAALATGGDDRDVVWTWTTPARTTADCTLVDPGGTGRSLGGCSSPLTTRLTNLPGTHRLDVVLTSNGGSSPVGSGTRSLTVPAPTAAVITGPAAGPDRAVAWSWPAAEDGASRCTLTGPDLSLTPACSPGGYATVLPEVNGEYVLTVVRTGPGGASSPATASYVLTLPTPTGPTVSAPTVDPATRLATWTWDQQPDEAAHCTLTGPGGVAEERDCAGTVSLTLPEANGDYVLGVVLTSVRGTSTPGYSPAYTLVLLRPASPAVSGPDTPGAARTVTYDWSLSGRETSTCTLVGPTTATRTDLPCAPPFTTELPATSGTYRLEVVLTSPGGSSLQPGTSPDYLLDVDPPAVPVLAGPAPGPVGSDPRPTWTVRLAAGATGRCTVTRADADGPVVVAGPASCGSASGEAYSPTLPADGAHTLSVVALDAFQNTSAPVTSAYLLDTAAPEAPVLAADRPTAGRGTAPSFGFTLPADAVSAACRTTAPDGTPGAVTSCTSPTVLQLGLRPDGLWTLEVWAVDAAGNRTATPATATYLLDTAPPALTVTGPQGVGNDPTPLWSWSATETAVEADCTLVRLAPDGSSPGTDVDTAPCADGTYRPRLPADADYAVRVRVADAQGNVASATTASYRYDATAPALPDVTGPTGRSTVQTVTWTWTGEGTPVCSLSRDGVSTGLDCTGRTLTTTLPGSGTYVLAVRMTDAAGNTGDPGSSAPYEVDTTAPLAPVVTGATFGSSRRPQFTVQAEEGASLVCRVLPPPGTVPPDPGPCTSPYTADLGAGPDGTYTVEVTATDALGNTGSAGRASYRLDTTAPEVPAVLGPVGTGNDPAPRYTWTGEEGTTAACRLLPATDLLPCTSPFVPSLTRDGSYAAQVVLTDAAGNASLPGSSGTYLYDGTPPGPAAVTGPPATGNSPSVTWSFTGEGTARCRLVHDGAAGDWTPCGRSYSAGLDADGAWGLEVELTDDAGNTSTAQSAAYLLDRVPPGRPSVSGPSGTGREATVTWSVSLEAGTTLECRLSGPDAGEFAACGSSVTRTLATDGSHVLQARATDAAGNTGPVGSSAAYLLDREAPGAPDVSGPTGPAQAPAPSWTFSAPDGTTAECAVLRDGVTVTDWASCGSPVVRDLSGLSDGAYVLSVRLTDGALNTGAAGSSPRYVLDRTAPAAPSVTGPTGPTRGTSPSVVFSGESGTSATCRVLRAGGPESAATPCTSPWTASLAGDGTWTAEVRLTDAAGNASPAGRSAGWVLDTQAPDAPVVSAPQSPGRDLQPTWSVVAEDGARIECRLTNPAGSVPDWAPCTFPYTTPVQGDGSYALEVRATDAAGGTSPTGRATYLLDTTPPSAPALTVPGTPSRDRAPSFTFSPVDGDTAGCRITRGAAVLQDWKACTSPAVVDLSTAADGAYTLAVRYTDLAGSTGPATTAVQVLDTTAPAAPKLTDVPASPNPTHRPRFSFTAEDGATYSCRVRTADNELLVDETCVSPWVPDLTAQPDGTYRVAVRATDKAGNTSDPATLTYVLDSTAPEAAVVTAPLSPASSRAPVWTVSAGGPAECRLSRGTTVLAEWRTCSGSYTADLSTAPDGTYVLSVRVPDPAGNLSALTTSSYVLDTVPAAAATITAPPSPSTTRTPTWVITAPEVGVTAVCRVLYGTGPLSGTVVRQESAPCKVSAAGEPFALDLTGAPDGSYELVVRLSDAAGNPGTEQRSAYLLDTVAPGAVSVVRPQSPSPDTSPTWFLSADAETTLECQLTSGGKVVLARATCTSPYTPDLTGRPDGSYTLGVRAVDAAGNQGPEDSSVFLLDKSAPVRPGAVIGPEGPSTDRHPTWTFVTEQGTTAYCTVTRGSTKVSEGACAAPWSVDLTGQPDGSYTLTVRAVDQAGNPSPPGQAAYVLDTTAPDAPTATLVPGSPSSTTTPRWAWSVPSDATSACRTTAGNAVLLDWAACTSPWTAALGDAPDGTYGLQVRAVDKAGNTSAPLGSEYVLDHTAGALAGFTDLPPAVARDDTPTWGLEVEPGQTLQCRLSGPDAVGAFA